MKHFHLVQALERHSGITTNYNNLYFYIYLELVNHRLEDENWIINQEKGLEAVMSCLFMKTAAQFVVMGIIKTTLKLKKYYLSR